MTTTQAVQPDRPGDRPSFVHLFLTWSCNLRCPQCFVSAGKKHPDEMSTLELLNLANEMVEMGIHTVHVEGGEVLLRRDAFAILQRLSRMRDVLLVTNGTRIDRDNAQRLAAVGLKRVAVSLDGATAETHDFFRPGTYDKIVDAIGWLREAGLEVRVSTTLMKPNVQEANRLLEACLDWGVVILNYDAFDLIGRGKEHPEFQLTSADWEVLAQKLLPRALEVSSRMQVKVAVPSMYVPLLKLDTEDPHFHWIDCTSGLSQLAITPDGSVIPCFALVTMGELCIGNVKEQSLHDLWRSSPRLNYYRTLTGDERCPIGYEGHLFFSNTRGASSTSRSLDSAPRSG